MDRPWIAVAAQDWLSSGPLKVPQFGLPAALWARFRQASQVSQFVRFPVCVERHNSEPVGAGNGGITGSLGYVVFSIVIGCRAAPDLFR